MFKKNLFLCLFSAVVVLLLSTATHVSAYSFSLEQLFILDANPDVPALVTYFFTFAIGIAGLLAVISLVVAGIQLIISTGNPEKISEAKKKAASAVIGLTIILASVIILNTINPQLKNLMISPTAQVGGVWLMPGKVPAPNFADDLDAARAQGYAELLWTETVEGLDGKSTPRNNCDQGNDKIVYDIYFFKKKGFQDYFAKGQIACGEKVSFPDGAKSYMMQKETPGVYLFTEPDCRIGDDGRLPIQTTASIPQIDKEIKSICIVNGPDEKRGPFFGVIYLNDPDYKTGEWSSRFQHLPFSDKTYVPCGCRASGEGFFGGFSDGASFVIYQWVGYDDNSKIASAGTGVTLYSRPGWSGGNYDVNTISQGQNSKIWYKDLSDTPIRYPANVNIPAEEKKQCQKFVTSGGAIFSPYHCLRSFEIKGNYLVLVSSEKDTGGQINGWAQVFPISPRLQQIYANRPEGYSIERGTPNLNADYIKTDYANYLEIIPLAKPLH